MVVDGILKMAQTILENHINPIGNPFISGIVVVGVPFAVNNFEQIKFCTFYGKHLASVIMVSKAQ